MNDRARRIDAHRPSFRALGKPGGRRRARPARDRFAFVPGNGLNMPERLELRQLLDGSNDLTTLISKTITNGVDGTFDLDTTFNQSSISLGNFLTAPDVTVTLSGVSQDADGGYTASVSVDAASASLNIGTVNGTIAATGQDTLGLHGSYSLSDQALDGGSYNLGISDLIVTVPGALKAEAQGVDLDYSPSVTTNQTLLTLASASGTLLPLNNATFTLKDLEVRTDGFSIADGTVSADAFSLGKVIDVTSPSLDFSGVGYTVGSPMTGTITASAASAASAVLFPGNSTLNASVTDFSGSYTLGSGALALSATSADLTVGKILDASATKIALTWDGTNATVDLGSAKLTSPLLPGAELDGSDIQGDNTGFSIGQADLKADEVNLGGVIDITKLDLGVTNLAYRTATNGVGGTFTSGTFTIGTQSASLFPGNTELTSSITGLAATYTLGTQNFALSATSADLTVGKILDASATKIALTWDGTNATVDLGSAKLTSPLLAGVELDGSDISGDNTGFSVGQADLIASEVNLGGVLDITNLDLGVTGLSYNINSKALDGTFTVTTGTVSILPNATAFTSSVTGFGATYALATDTLTVKADSASITLGTTLNVTANTLGFTLTPTTNPVTGDPDDSVMVSIGSAIASLPQENVLGSITGLTITNDGFHLDSATLTDTSSAPFTAFGGKFSITGPSVSLTNFGYSLSAGAEFNSDLTLTATEIDFNPTSPSSPAGSTSSAPPTSWSTRPTAA